MMHIAMKISVCMKVSSFAAMLVISSTPALAQSEDHVVIGAGVAVIPTYQGSDDYRTLPIPAIDIKQGIFFAGLRNGVGIAPVDAENVTIGVSAVFIQGYRRRDVPDGIGRVSSGVGARAFASVRTNGFVTTLGVVQGISGGTEGVIADASLSYPISLSSRVSLTPAVSTTWANAKHNDLYFGVTETESLASGLPRFAAGSGFKDVTLSLTASYRLTERFTLSATGTASTLLGDVRNSPIVERKTQPTGIISLSYRM